jgi:hypothetical protein
VGGIDGDEEAAGLDQRREAGDGILQHTPVPEQIEERLRFMLARERPESCAATAREDHPIEIHAAP